MKVFVWTHTVSAQKTQANARTAGRKLTVTDTDQLAHRFFVWGSLVHCDYGAAPVMQFNEHQSTSVQMPDQLRDDTRLLERLLGVGFFHYGPRLWMIGEVEPLKALQDPGASPAIIDRVLTEYPGRILPADETFYRIRKAPSVPHNEDEYDSPLHRGIWRFDTPGRPVTYSSPNLQFAFTNAA